MLKDLTSLADYEAEIIRLEIQRQEITGKVRSIREIKFTNGKGYSATTDEIKLLNEYHGVLESLGNARRKYEELGGILKSS